LSSYTTQQKNPLAVFVPIFNAANLLKKWSGLFQGNIQHLILQEILKKNLYLAAKIIENEMTHLKGQKPRKEKPSQKTQRQQ